VAEHKNKITRVLRDGLGYQIHSPGPEEGALQLMDEINVGEGMFLGTRAQ
jgi:hypothetical protein